jgi:hypothetical protein
MFLCQEDKLWDEGQGYILLAVIPFALKLLGAWWFLRAWCAHEIRLALYLPPNNPLLLCYGHLGQVISFEFRFIYYLILYLSSSIPEERPQITGLDFWYAMNDLDPTSL